MSRHALYGCLALALAVGFGAFGAHALRDLLPPASLTVWETANRYHFYHGFALILTGLLATQPGWPFDTPPKIVGLAGGLFLIGLILFSGSLYLLAYTGIRWLGAITPLGGASWIIGWLCLARGLALREQR